MKKLSIFLMGLIFVLSLTGLSIAQEKAKPGKAPEAVKPGGAKAESVKKEGPAEPMEYRVGGIITDISAVGKKITIKQHQVKRERIVTLMMNENTAKELSNLKVGDSINVWVKGKRITALERVA